MERKYHFLYKITNLVNQKYYIGVHNTDNLEDGYLGSGFAIQRALEKYGPSNFKREIISFFNSSEEAFLAEEKIVTEELIKDPNCYNLILGGRSTGFRGLKKEIYLQKRLKYLTQEEKEIEEKNHQEKLKKMRERQKGLQNPETKKRFEIYKNYFNETMKYLYEETTCPDIVIEWLFMGKGFKRNNPTKRFIESGMLKNPLKTLNTNCCSFQQKQKKTLFTENPKECIVLDIFENNKKQNVTRRFEHLPDLLRFSKDMKISNSMLNNGKTNYKCEKTDAKWFIERGILEEETVFIKIEKNDGRILNKVPKSIFKLREQETIILDKELNFYGIDEFGYLCKKGEFRKG